MFFSMAINLKGALYLVHFESHVLRIFVPVILQKPFFLLGNKAQAVNCPLPPFSFKPQTKDCSCPSHIRSI